ncbi:MAG: YesL family protein, partial [Defluviitaleaceae bacterium]|nr:YesL family protein [Defluviitaleaceae bacterium]
SLVWIFFCLPVFTIGASTTALFYVATRRLANREGYITADFWAAFKSNFKRATMFWVLIFFVVAMILLNFLLALENPELMGSMQKLILPAQIVILAEVLFITNFIFPVTARFDMNFKETLKSSFFMANRHLLTSFACVATPALLFVASVEIFPPLLFLIPGISAMVSSSLIMRVFKKYRPEMDKDPFLELQEIERERARRAPDFEDSSQQKNQHPENEIPNEE